MVGSGSSTLKSTDIFYWPGNALSYGFEAVASNEKLNDQTQCQIDFGRQIWICRNFRIHMMPWSSKLKEWKTANSSGLFLFSQASKSMITVVLKAGEGVSRGALTYNVNNTALSDAIFSYETRRLMM